MRFAMGNIAYAIGVGQGLVGTVRTLARGEVREFSSMYNEIRHTALRRLRQEASEVGANAVPDVRLKMLPYGPGTLELLLTGTASYNRRLSAGAVPEHEVVTSELTSEELWNLAKMGYAPHQIVMATSVYALGVVGGLEAMFRAIKRGELPEVTRLIYDARENCLDLVRQEAEALGAERVIGNRLQVREIAKGLVEVVALGTAVKRREDIEPESKDLIPQAVIVSAEARGESSSIQTLAVGGGGVLEQYRSAAATSASAFSTIYAILILIIVSVGFCGVRNWRVSETVQPDEAPVAAPAEAPGERVAQHARVRDTASAWADQ